MSDDQPADSPFEDSREGSIEVGIGRGLQELQLQPVRARRDLHLSHILIRGRVGGVDEQSHRGDGGNQLLQHLQPLRLDFGEEQGHAGKIVARPGEACDQTELYRIAAGGVVSRRRESAMLYER